jgi:hypothetical protein
MMALCETCLPPHKDHMEQSVVGVECMSKLWQHVMTSAAVDYDSMQIILRRQRSNKVKWNPFMRKRDSRFQNLHVNPATEGKCKEIGIIQHEPVYPMLYSEYAAGVQYLLKTQIKKWPIFQQAIQLLTDVHAFDTPRVTATEPAESRAGRASRIMRRMELYCLSYPDKFREQLQEASEFLHGGDDHKEDTKEEKADVEEIKVPPTARQSVDLMCDQYQAAVNSMYTQWRKRLAEKKVRVEKLGVCMS